MDIRKVKKLIELLEESDVAEIEIHEGEESVRISRASSLAAPMFQPPVAVAATAPSTTKEPVSAAATPYRSLTTSPGPDPEACAAASCSSAGSEDWPSRR